MEKFMAMMNRKVAGVPVMWIALLVALVALYAAVRMKGSGEEPGEETDPDAIAGDGDIESDLGIDSDQPVFKATPVIYQPSGGSVAATPQEDTNELWARRSIEWLTANGYTLTVATTAIAKYMDGDTLSVNEGAARDKAVKQFGLPPEGILPTSTASAATPKPPASRQGTPPTTHTVKSSNDNQPGELARLYYGLDNADTRRQILAANTKVPNPFPVGAKVTIPKRVNPKYYRSTAATNTLYEIARKNGVSAPTVQALNPSMKFPVKAGTRVRVK